MTPMRKTKLSLYYVAGYLTFGGIGLLLAPSTVLSLFLSNGDYGDIMPRLAGALLLGLGIAVIQIMRHEAEDLYSTTLIIRAVILAVLIWLYSRSRDPLFFVLTGVVGLGWVLTLLSYLGERAER